MRASDHASDGRSIQHDKISQIQPAFFFSRFFFLRSISARGPRSGLGGVLLELGTGKGHLSRNPSSDTALRGRSFSKSSFATPSGTPRYGAGLWTRMSVLNDSRGRGRGGGRHKARAVSDVEAWRRGPCDSSSQAADADARARVDRSDVRPKALETMALRPLRMDVWSGGIAESALTGHREPSVRNGGTQGLNKFNLPGPNDRARGLTAEMSPWPVSEARFRISSHRVERARDHRGALDTTQ